MTQENIETLRNICKYFNNLTLASVMGIEQEAVRRFKNGNTKTLKLLHYMKLKDWLLHRASEINLFFDE